jgi:catalase
VGQTWPVKGRIIGIVAGPDSDLKTLGSVQQSILDNNMVPLVVAPVGGVLGSGRNAVTVQRTFATARSVEFDALLLAGAPGAAADASGARDAKAGNGTTDPAAADPRVLLMLAEAYRHAKPIAALDGGQQVLQAAGIPAQAPGVLAGEDPIEVLTATIGLLGQHRVWDRFPVPAPV